MGGAILVVARLLHCNNIRHIERLGLYQPARLEIFTCVFHVLKRVLLYSSRVVIFIMDPPSNALLQAVAHHS